MKQEFDAKSYVLILDPDTQVYSFFYSNEIINSHLVRKAEIFRSSIFINVTVISKYHLDTTDIDQLAEGI